MHPGQIHGSRSLRATSERVAELRVEGFDAHGRVADLTDETQVRELGQWADEARQTGAVPATGKKRGGRLYRGARLKAQGLC